VLLGITKSLDEQVVMDNLLVVESFIPEKNAMQ
jgi:hypothetical protein